MRATFTLWPVAVVEREVLVVREPQDLGHLAVWVRDDPRPYRAELDALEVQGYLARWAALAGAARGTLRVRD